MGKTTSKPETIMQYVGAEETKGETRPFRSIDVPLTEPLVDKFPGGISTLLMCFETMREKLGPKPLYGTREKTQTGLGEYKWKSYDEVYRIVTAFAKAFTVLDLLSEIEYSGTKLRAIGVFCKTREEWLYTWIACWYSTACIVPLYDTLGEESIEWIIDQAELKCVVTTTPFISKLIKLKQENKVPTLKSIVILDPLTNEEKEGVEKVGLKLTMFQECIEIGSKSSVVLKPEIQPSSIATICYTSGTTSRPKGVMLSHRNYVSMAEGVKRLPYVQPKKDDSCICWLPLAHVFEQFTAAVMLAMGVKLGFYSGDVTKLPEDMQVLRPQFFGSVPRVLNRIYDQAMKEVNRLSGFKKKLYDRAVSVKLDNLRKSGTYTHWFYDRFVFNKISGKLGGRMGLIFVGGAPLSPEVLEMSRIWLSCAIVQGYGQTETTGPIVAQTPDDTYPASIGAPLPHAEAKLVDVPEMKYFSTDMTEGKPTPRGEIWLRGPAIAAGYWKEPELTKDTFTADGWVKTGDIATMAPTGHIVIIDRKKHIFKLAQGEYIAPEKLENIYQRSEFVSQIFICGDSHKTYIVAIVVPKEDRVQAWAKANNISGNYQELCKNQKLKEDILKDLEKVGRDAKLNSLEIVRNAHLSTTPFTAENDTLTPTLKIKRYQAGKMYEMEIKRLYEEPAPQLNAKQ